MARSLELCSINMVCRDIIDLHSGKPDGVLVCRGPERGKAMDKSDRLDAMARWMWDARRHRQPYRNLPEALRPQSIAEAYAAQEIYYRLVEPVYGAVGGAKIATTTKVMQQLMGITHPCGGAIFARTIHVSPACLRTADFVNLRIESEIALKLGAGLPASGAPWTREAVASAVVGAMPAFELIEDRNADYTAADAASLIVENCWNGGVVIGTPKVVSVEDLVGIAGRLMVGGTTIGEGMAEDPCATLAWLANHLAERGRDLKAGMVVITGSVIPTVSIAVGHRAVFSVDRLGEAVIDVL
jgi:2-keto-4-pentenoate hydratase